MRIEQLPEPRYYYKVADGMLMEYSGSLCDILALVERLYSGGHDVTAYIDYQDGNGMHEMKGIKPYRTGRPIVYSWQTSG